MNMEIDSKVNDVIVKIIDEKFDGRIEHDSLELTVESGSKKGDNYLGVILCVSATFRITNSQGNQNDDRRRFDLIIKKAPRSPAFRKIFPIRQAFSREVHLYTKVLPEFAKFQQYFGVKKPFKAYVDFYNYSLANSQEYLIMCNMKSLNYGMCDRKKTMDYKHSQLVFRELGRFHALSFAMKSKQPDNFYELTKNCYEILFSNCDLSQMSQSFEINKKLILATFDQNRDREIIDKLNLFFARGLRSILDYLDPDKAGRFAVMLHGDSWTNNLLFTYTDTNNEIPHKLCFLDWQLSRLGSPMLDLIYYLFSCTGNELRGERLKKLFLEYHQSLAEMLAEFGCDIEKLFPFDILMDHYRKFAAYGFSMATLITRLIVSESEDIPDFVELCDKKNDVSKSFDFSSKNHNVYCKRIHDLARYCVEQNLI